VGRGEQRRILVPPDRLENAGGALFSSLENLAGGALKAAKSFLGINSPSKLFADEVGLSIPEGIAKGINDNAGIAHRAVAALSSGLTATAHTAVTGSMSIAGSGLTALGQGGGGGATIEIHNHFEGANVMSDADMTQIAAKVGKAVTKSLAPGGLHLRIT
jgi:hypothetical protein